MCRQNGEGPSILPTNQRRVLNFLVVCFAPLLGGAFFVLYNSRTRRYSVRSSPPRPGRPLRKGAALRKQCGPASRARARQCGTVWPLAAPRGKGRGGQALARLAFCASMGVLFLAAEKVPKRLRPREPQKSLSNGKFYNSRGARAQTIKFLIRLKGFL